MSITTQIQEEANDELAKLKLEIKARDELIHKLKGELMYIWEDVWPLVHGLTSRQTVKDRFKRLPDVINSQPSTVTPVKFEGCL